MESGENTLDWRADRSWYLFQSDEHQGPFTAYELRCRVNRDARPFVWKEGMSDWTPFDEVTDFIEMKEMPQPVFPKTESSFDERMTIEETSQAVLPEPVEAVPVAKVSIRTAMMFLTGGFALVAIFAFKKPALPDLPDLTGAEFAELEEGTTGWTPQAAIVMPRSQLERPVFYISSNLSEGSRFRVLIKGISDTLVGRFSAFAQADISTRSHVGRTPPLEYEGGGAFPMGEYKVSVECLSCSEKGRMIAEKSFFIGGDKDAFYEINLRKYHSKLREQASAELLEIKQFTETLEHQLTDSTSHFEGFLQHKSARPWREFNRKWSKFEAQLKSMAGEWTDARLENELFYGELYRSLKQALDMVNKIEENRAHYVSLGRSSGRIEEEIATQASVAQSALLAIRAQTAMVERIPALPNGMPQKKYRNPKSVP